MPDLFNKLYSQFLNGKIDSKDFRDFKEALRQLPDSDLSEKMEANWNENDNFPAMPLDNKQEIRRRLLERINPYKKNLSARWYRIVSVAAVAAMLSVVVWNISLLRNQQNAAAPNLVFFLSYTDECSCIRVSRIKNVGNYHIQLIGLRYLNQVYVVNSHVFI